MDVMHKQDKIKVELQDINYSTGTSILLGGVSVIVWLAVVGSSGSYLTESI